MIQSLGQSIRCLLVVTLLCCVLYPGVAYLLADGVFSYQARGSLIMKDGAVVGSELIGQYNDKPEYFWPRPSVGEVPYQPGYAKASHLPYMSDAYQEAIITRYHAMKKAHPEYSGAVPIDMITSSASGLDPHISPEAAMMQIGRVTKVRKLDRMVVNQLIQAYTEEKQWGLFGSRRVNVLRLNLALDEVGHHGR